MTFDAQRLREPGHGALTDPDNPPWSAPVALLFWVTSVVLLGLASFAFLLPYARQRGVKMGALAEFAVTDPTAIFIQIASTLPAHLFTLGLAWLIVTRAGRYPFLQTLGWGWGGLSLWRSVGLAVLLLIVGVTIIHLTGSPETPLDQIIKSSRAAALTTAFVATFTAPIVEEVVYRGVLYSALRRALGPVLSVLTVVALFALVHVPQYKTSYGVIAVILLLSFFLTIIRAYTGKLLPCIVIHMVFNGIQSLDIAFRPYLERYATPDPPVIGCVLRAAASALSLG